ncbi:hypothetical protein ACFLQU_00200 [Verrucomicrobiota bacterium]
MTPARHDQASEGHGKGHIYGMAMRNSFMDFCAGLGRGTDRMADVFVDAGKDDRRSTGRRLGRESVDMVKSIARDIKHDMTDVSFRGIVCDASYGVGRLSRKTRDMDYGRALCGVTRKTGKVSASVAATDFRNILQGTSHEMGKLAGVTRNVICARS